MRCIVCSFRLASFILRLAAVVRNLLLTKNLVADLQESFGYLVLLRALFQRFSNISFKDIDPLLRNCVA